MGRKRHVIEVRLDPRPIPGDPTEAEVLAALDELGVGYSLSDGDGQRSALVDSADWETAKKALDLAASRTSNRPRDGDVVYYLECREELLSMQGDRAEHKWVHDQPDDFGWYNTAEEAVVAARAYMADKRNVVNPQRDDIGSVTYFTAEVDRRVYDADYGDWTFPDDCEVESLSTLDGSPEKRAFDRAMESKWEWLDYEDDGYDTVSFYLDLMDKRDSKGLGEKTSSHARAPRHG